ncbi:gamma-secretase-activating protein isoform X8 [Mustelus asterias]
MLELKPLFDIEEDVAPWLLNRRLTSLDEEDESTSPSRKELQIVNVEKNGSILYTWKGMKGNTCIGIYDPHNKQNQLLYAFDREAPLISCSVNTERTLLAVSILQFTRRGLPVETFRPVSRCLTLLIEIHPVNNTKVLKAVDSHVRVQFIHPAANTRAFPENHLLVVSEDRCIEHVHIRVAVEEGCRVVVQNPDRLHKTILAEDFLWAQWDTQEQRLFYIVEKENNAVLMCIQFYPDRNYEMQLSFPLGLSLTATKLRLVNFGFNHFQEEEESLELLNLQVFTNHAGWRKTFAVSLEASECDCITEPTFINIGKDAKVKPWNDQRYMLSLPGSVLDCQLGKMYKADLNPQLLLLFMRGSKLDCHQLAALHCAVFYLQDSSETETQIIHWMCGMPVSGSFDLIQEFILGTLYRKAISETNTVDKLLPYTSLFNWDGEIPGITYSTEKISQPAFGEKIQNLQGFWEELNRNVESMKNLESLHNPWHNNSSMRKIKAQLFSNMKVDERANKHFRNTLENAKKVLSKVDKCSSEQQAVPLFQEEDCHQMVLTGLMVEKLKEYLLNYLHYIGRKKIDLIVNNYVVNLLGCIWQIVDKIWKKYGLKSHILCLSSRETVNPAEFIVFHMMTRVLEAVEGLFLPLPPELDNSETNESLKFSIVTRIPETFGQKICHLWDHPISSSCIARNYVETLLRNHCTQQKSKHFSLRDKTPFESDFLPLTYLARFLTEVEDQALNPFEDQENVDAKFVEVAALKQTLTILGLEDE